MVREFLADARVDNSRKAAAAIGEQLADLAADDAPATGAAADVVRDASLHLFKTLHGEGDIEGARRYALIAVDCLEAVLPGGELTSIVDLPGPISKVGLAERLKGFVAARLASDLSLGFQASPRS